MFGISRQVIYQKQARLEQRNQELKQVKAMVQEVRMDLPRIGTRKVYFLLEEAFSQSELKIGRDALFDFLRSENMLIRPLKNYTKTTNSKHWLKKHPNLYNGVDTIERPEQFFVSDITYIKSRQRTNYLSLVTDAFSRQVMGYKLSNNMEAENVVKALDMALKNRKTSKN